MTETVLTFSISHLRSGSMSVSHVPVDHEVKAASSFDDTTHDRGVYMTARVNQPSGTYSTTSGRKYCLYLPYYGACGTIF